MAASNTHGVTASTMLALLPFAAGTVTASSNGLTTGELTAWINEAAGQLNSLLERHGIDPDAVSGNTSELVVSGIRAYVRARALSDGKFPESQVSREWETWQSIRKTLRDDPQSLGEDQSASKQVKSNVDPDNVTTTRFSFGSTSTDDIF